MNWQISRRRRWARFPFFVAALSTVKNRGNRRVRPRYLSRKAVRNLMRSGSSK